MAVLNADMTPAPASARGIAVLAAAFVLCAVVAWQLIVPGPFDWALVQPQTWQGGFEAVALLALLASSQWVRNRAWRWLAVPAGVLFFARRHAVDAPILLCVFHLELTVALGAAAQRLLRAPPPQSSEDYLRCFVLGIGLWSVAAWTAAASGYGTPVALRLVTLLLLPLALWARCRPLSVHLLASAGRCTQTQRVLIAVIAGWLLILFARTNYAYSFDGLWYGLRPEYMLVADGTPFAPLGLVSPVHYFPKLYEIYLLPLSGFGSASAMSGVTVLVLGLLALAAVRLAARLGLTDTNAQLALALLVLTLPAIANPALEPKPDIPCALFVMLAAVFAGDAVTQRNAVALVWSTACMLLAVSCKLVAVPYLGMMGLGLAGAFLWRRRFAATAMSAAPLQRRIALAALLLTAASAGFVVARTWLLSGLPTIGPDPLYRIWTSLGLQLHEPAGTLTWTFPQEWGDVPALIVDWLLRPQRLEHIAISWVGNVWLWLPAAALLLRARRIAPPGGANVHRWLLAWLAAAGLVLALGWRYHVRGSDGNYFIAALVPALTLAVAFAWRQPLADRAKRILLGGTLLFCAFQAAYAFVSAAWTPGTRPFDLVLDRSPREQRERANSAIERAGLREVADYLRGRPGVARVIGCVPAEAGFRLPARFEDIPTIALSRPEYVADLGSAVAFMRRFSIRYLLLPKPAAAAKPDSEWVDGCRPVDAPPAGTRTVAENAKYLLVEPVAQD
ncbi:MAG: hypothetical protein BGP24_01170 [Lysobacterales bacterium 69-70]|nr:MAG: hypothetical protein ABS97_01800 [Xanthomonadaceae bacterium SCN 69-320]ODV18165.1 MAG: hypothetical protein ABT27_14640 [Xanthomonadaceae bacterium SCN 69-25]OJY99448.1 MAG: hypothetical protein BGP24_01170 [Xanthomonadales bacterium 69-70]